MKKKIHHETKYATGVGSHDGFCIENLADSIRHKSSGHENREVRRSSGTASPTANPPEAIRRPMPNGYSKNVKVTSLRASCLASILTG